MFLIRFVTYGCKIFINTFPYEQKPVLNVKISIDVTRRRENKCFLEKSFSKVKKIFAKMIAAI